MIKKLQAQLFKLQDTRYKDFQSKLIPSIKKQTVIGVRTPILKSLAKELIKTKTKNELNVFLQDLPHTYFEENQLHAFIICGQKNYDECIQMLEDFLPFIDNWATCDQLSPKVFSKNAQSLLPHIKKWILTGKTYYIRFAIGMLMHHFLDENFDTDLANLVCKIRSDEYYVNMMIAWYFATALAKQWTAIIPFIEKQKLEMWTHNKTIQKACESFRIGDKQKQYLRTLKNTGASKNFSF